MLACYNRIKKQLTFTYYWYSGIIYSIYEGGSVGTWLFEWNTDMLNGLFFNVAFPNRLICRGHQIRRLFELNHSAPSHFHKFSNRKYLLGKMSMGIATKQECTFALSWLKSTFFWHNIGQIFCKTSLNRFNKLAHYSLLIFLSF